MRAFARRLQGTRGPRPQHMQCGERSAQLGAQGRTLDAQPPQRPRRAPAQGLLRERARLRIIQALRRVYPGWECIAAWLWGSAQSSKWPEAALRCC